MCLASVVTMYSLFSTTFNHVRKWPMVLVLFWPLYVVFDLVLVTLAVVKCFELKNMHALRSKSNIIYIVTLPFAIILCYNGVKFCGINKKHKKLEEPLLQENGQEDSSAFTNAGIWNRVTFNWINPLFELGHAQKLEFSHVPSIPESEMAGEAVFLLEESIHKQKTHVSISPKGIIHAVRRSLAINAVVAGPHFVPNRYDQTIDGNGLIAPCPMQK
nr:putative ABC transporter C family member 15 [Tanacetum cinerariifolium]